MAGKLKRADKKYILSDSSVNCYGFRLLTEGYLADEYARNPIGYYMHQREGGVVVRWEDLSTDGDCITGYPVINLSNERGPQTLEEIESGFLNAASMGHIVVLEWTTEPSQMLPGQTGPTITKWYNKECSLVDVPGNSNAVTALYDAGNNPITLADLTLKLTATSDVAKHTVGDMGLHGLTDALQLTGTTNLAELSAAVIALSNRAATAEANFAALMQSTANKDINSLLDRALDERKITVQLKATLERDYHGKPAELAELLGAMPRYVSISQMLRTGAVTDEAKWTWGDYELNDPSGQKLSLVRDQDPVRYTELYEQRFKSPRN